MLQAINPFYPYRKIADYTTLPDAETLLKKIVDYLLDLPMKGYEPPDGISTPRSRLIRLLYYDESHPLEKPLPTPQQKLSIVFDPESPDVPPTDKGYRIYPMIYPVEAQSRGQTVMHIFMGYARPVSDLQIEQSIEFQVLTNTQFENNQHSVSLSRTYQICVEIIRALHGVNMEGVGGFYFNRRLHTDCGLEPIADKAQNVGYRLVMGLTFMGSADQMNCGC